MPTQEIAELLRDITKLPLMRVITAFPADLLTDQRLGERLDLDEPQWNSELLQRCCSRVRTALAIGIMRFGLHRDLRRIRQDFRRATPRSTAARAAARARLTVFSVWVSSCRGLRLMPVFTQGRRPGRRDRPGWGVPGARKCG